MTDKLERDLGRVEGKLDRVIEKLDRMDARLDKQDGRISTLENRQYYVMGGGAVLGAIIAFIGSLAKDLFRL